MGEAASYLQLISERIDGIHMLAAGDGNPYRRTVSFNKAKCKYLAQELATKIQSNIATLLNIPAAKGDTVGPVLRHIAFAVETAEDLVRRSCEEKWWNEIFWMGDSTEAFGDVLLNLQAAIDIALGDGSCIDRSISRSRAELGQEWSSMVLHDRSFLECNVRLVVHHRYHPATGRALKDKDLEIAKHVQAKLDGTGPCNVIELGMVRIVKTIVGSITCINWLGRNCVLKRFVSDEYAKKEADIMKDLMHPHVVLLFGYARRRRLFSQPSPNILLEYAERGDLRQYIENLYEALDADVIVNVMLEIAKGMCYIHSKKIAHLDLKSMNVFVTSHTIENLHAAKFFHVKIGDFGTAMRCNDGPIPDWVYGQGTHRWRAPELFKEAPHSDLDLYKADVYSYAMVCVELVTRQLPLQERFPKRPNPSELYAYISESSNRPSLPETYPPELLSIIRCCWDAEPSKRPSFEDIVESLESLKGEMLLNDKFYSALPTWISPKLSNRNDVWTRQAYRYSEGVGGGGGGGGGGKKCEKKGEGGGGGEKKGGGGGGGEKKGGGGGGGGKKGGGGGGGGKKGGGGGGGERFGREGGGGGGREGEVDEMVKKATMSPIFVIQTIHPPFSAEGWEMLIELGEDVRRKIDDFVHGGATMGQHMYTSRASHLQPILSEFQAQLHLLFGHAHHLDTKRNELFDEVFNVLKRVEFLLGSCSWPAIEFHGGPTATDEAFLSLLRNLDHCVQMMRYSLTLPQPTNAPFEEVSKLQAGNPNEDSWSRACELDRQMLVPFLYSHTMMFLGTKALAHHHWYMASIAVLSKDSTMYSEGPATQDIPLHFVRQSEKNLLDEGPNGLVMGPMPFFRQENYIFNVGKKAVYHQRLANWVVKVYAHGTRKLAYDFITLASLQHPHVMQMFGAWEDGDSSYVAMKMMQTNVMQFLSQKQEKKLSAMLLLTILVQIAEGMSYMHSHHVRHHNLKCSNVLLGGIYENLEIVHVEVSDYGLERQQVSEEGRDLESSSSTTVPIKDSVQFGEGEETDEYAFDVYQFAMLCSEIFSIRGSQEESEIPSEATSSGSGELDEEAATVSFPAKCPREVAMYLQKCGSKDPKQRPQFAEISTVLRNHRAFMILRGDQGTGCR